MKPMKMDRLCDLLPIDGPQAGNASLEQKDIVQSSQVAHTLTTHAHTHTYTALTHTSNHIHIHIHIHTYTYTHT